MDRRTALKALALAPVVPASASAGQPPALPVPPPPNPPPMSAGPRPAHVLFATAPPGGTQEPAMVAVFNPKGQPPLGLKPWYDGIDRKFRGFDVILPGDYRVSFDLVGGYLHQEFGTEEGHRVRLGDHDAVTRFIGQHYINITESNTDEINAYVADEHPGPGTPADRPRVVMLKARRKAN